MVRLLSKSLRSAVVRTAAVVGSTLLVAGFGVSAARAQFGYPGQYGGPGYGQYQDPYQVAGQNGYDHGFEHGSNDRNRRKSYDVRRDDDYEDADRGYDKHLGIAKDEYKRAFRAAYEQGYADGYNGRGTFGNSQPSYRQPSYRRPSFGRRGFRLPFPF